LAQQARQGEYDKVSSGSVKVTFIQDTRSGTAVHGAVHTSMLRRRRRLRVNGMAGYVAKAPKERVYLRCLISCPHPSEAECSCTVAGGNLITHKRSADCSGCQGPRTEQLSAPAQSQDAT
jgi:hypothetical protein